MHISLDRQPSLTRLSNKHRRNELNPGGQNSIVVKTVVSNPKRQGERVNAGQSMQSDMITQGMWGFQIAKVGFKRANYEGAKVGRACLV